MKMKPLWSQVRVCLFLLFMGIPVFFFLAYLRLDPLPTEQVVWKEYFKFYFFPFSVVCGTLALLLFARLFCGLQLPACPAVLRVALLVILLATAYCYLGLVANFVGPVRLLPKPLAYSRPFSFGTFVWLVDHIDGYCCTFGLQAYGVLTCLAIDPC